MEIIAVGIGIAILISLYSLWIAMRMTKVMYWILKNVHIVGNSKKLRDVEWEAIKNSFGIADDVMGPEE
jgi:hypothetical protein